MYYKIYSQNNKIIIETYNYSMNPTLRSCWILYKNRLLIIPNNDTQILHINYGGGELLICSYKECVDNDNKGFDSFNDFYDYIKSIF